MQHWKQHLNHTLLQHTQLSNFQITNDIFSDDLIVDAEAAPNDVADFGKEDGFHVLPDVGLDVDDFAIVGVDVIRNVVVEFLLLVEVLVDLVAEYGPYLGSDGEGDSADDVRVGREAVLPIILTRFWLIVKRYFLLSLQFFALNFMLMINRMFNW